ncbi:MAG: hydroxysqualene dehydroxylase HpnE [Candidatus Accumulibacter sp.]|nr:hydroxysqualene dehydroxylase HpnE [Accumulibacter sp.]
MSGVNAGVAIVGGGWAGLACAVDLSAAGVPVRVFEAARQLGGRARRVDIAGHALDNGQHLLLGAYRETLRIMRRSGADPERLLRRLPLELVYPHQGFRLRLPRLPAPLHLAIGLLTARGGPPGEKLAAARFIHALRAGGYRLAEPLTVAGLLDRHRQRGNLRRLLWEPLCLAALNTAPEHASAQIFANVLRDGLDGARENSDLLLPQADLGRVFPDAAARFIGAHGGEIRLSTRVGQIAQLTGNGGKFAHVVIATAPRQAAELLREAPETRAIAALLDSYRYEPVGTVYLAYPEEIRLPSPMFGLCGPLGQWVFDRGPPGGASTIVACVLSAQGVWDTHDNESLAAALHGELQQTLGRALPDPDWRRVIRERHAAFSCRPGLPRPPAKTARPGLWLAGDYVYADYPATLESAVRSGCHVAREILDAR